MTTARLAANKEAQMHLHMLAEKLHHATSGSGRPHDVTGQAAPYRQVFLYFTIAPQIVSSPTPGVSGGARPVALLTLPAGSRQRGVVPLLQQLRDVPVPGPLPAVGCQALRFEYQHEVAARAAAANIAGPRLSVQTIGITAIEVCDGSVLQLSGRLLLYLQCAA
jgi:hypothetical protein